MESAGKKISLKIMTLNNSRQKINDCLGNPVEIGIAVMWRVVDKSEDNVLRQYRKKAEKQKETAALYPYGTGGSLFKF